MNYQDYLSIKKEYDILKLKFEVLTVNLDEEKKQNIMLLEIINDLLREVESTTNKLSLQNTYS